jgi:hypothetical protein
MLVDTWAATSFENDAASDWFYGVERRSTRAPPSPRRSIMRWARPITWCSTRRARRSRPQSCRPAVPAARRGCLLNPESALAFTVDQAPTDTRRSRSALKVGSTPDQWAGVQKPGRGRGDRRQKRGVLGNRRGVEHSCLEILGRAPIPRNPGAGEHIPPDTPTRALLLADVSRQTSHWTQRASAAGRLHPWPKQTSHGVGGSRGGGTFAST